MASQMDKEIDAAIAGIVMGIGRGIKMVFYGIKKLNTVKNVIFLLVTLVISVVTYIFQNYVFKVLEMVDMPGILQKIVFIMILCLPFIFSNYRQLNRPDGKRIL